MIDHLAFVAQREGISAEPAALGVIAAKADGAMRDALSIFDQIAASSGGNITYQAAIDNLNVLDHSYYHRLLDTILAGDVLSGWKIYKEIRDNGFDSQFFINGLAGYMRDLMVARDPSTLHLIEAGDDVKAQLSQRAAKCSPDFLYRAMCLCNDADLNYRAASNKQFLIELTLAKICQQLSPSRSNSDGNGEGQLKPIIAVSHKNTSSPVATNSTPSVQATPQAPVTASATAPEVKPITPTPVKTTPSPVAPSRPAPAIGIPRISIRNGVQAQNNQSPTESRSQNRNEYFSPEALASAWETYIQTHPKAHILINTMRASMPQMTDKTSFVISVQNQKQMELMEYHRPELLSYLRDNLSNDSISYTVYISTSENPRHTLNDSELLKKMADEYPALRNFINEFKLRLG